MQNNNSEFAQQAQQKIDLKTKPLGSLGALERLAQQICMVQNTLNPVLQHPAHLVFAADHGIAHSGVSAYPADVTAQMVLNFLQGGAAINVFCQQHNIDLKIADAGVNYDFGPHANLLNTKIAPGTQNFLHQPAMTDAQLQQCLDHAQVLVADLAAQGCNIMGYGEMGIGNTAASAMLMSALCGLPLEQCVGRGTGLDDAQLQRKLQVLQQAQKNHPAPADARAALACFGGFEIAQMCGAMLASYAHNMLILVDGFIATAAYLCAVKMQPEIQQNAIFCHQSDEQGHRLLLQYLQAEPLLHLKLRLGEGTGCALAYPLIESAVNFVNQMASFASAGVSNKS